MIEFSVWAPHRSQMAVVVEGKKTEMEPTASGWWTAELASPDDADYMFELDAEELRPDPRSRFQPEGVHGVSRLVNPSTFQWTDSGFQALPLSAAIFYELHVGTFTPQGTFESAIDKLPHLVRLGITHVELMPIAEIAGTRGWGYDGVYPYAPHHVYGGPQGLQRVVDACHSEGLAVVLDVVYNHLGPAGNYLPRFGPYFSDRHKTPWGSAINFDGPFSDEVRRYFIENAKMWLRDYHIDGLRLDAVHAIVDTSAVPFLEQLSIEVKQLEAHLGRYLVVIAESDLNDPRIVQSRDRGGFGLDAQWSDDFHHAVHVALTEEQHGYYCDFCGLDDLAAVFKQPFLLNRRFSRFRQRSHGRVPTELNGWKFLAYSQNHDQTGNRASGERLHQIANLRRAKIAAALTLFSPYVPLLFQGEEWAASSPFQYFVDFSDDPELARAVSEGRLSDFEGFQGAEVPDPQCSETFERSRLDWREVDRPPHAEMLAWYRELIALRRGAESLVDGSFDDILVHLDKHSQCLSVRRGNLQMSVNLSDEPQTIAPESNAGEFLLKSEPEVRLTQEGIELPAESVAIIQHGQAPRARRKESHGTEVPMSREQRIKIL